MREAVGGRKEGGEERTSKKNYQNFKVFFSQNIFSKRIFEVCGMTSNVVEKEGLRKTVYVRFS